MRALILLTSICAVGCASQPGNPQTQVSSVPAPAVSAPGASKPTESVEAQRLAAAKNLHMKVIDKDGQQLFCRSNLMTGSHIQRDETCYTADQLDNMQAQMQRDLDRLDRRPSASKGLP